MELPFSAWAQPGGDGNDGGAMTGTGQSSRRARQTGETHLSSKGIQMARGFFCAWKCRHASGRESGVGG
jgi:hypothetical protein